MSNEILPEHTEPDGEKYSLGGRPQRRPQRRILPLLFLLVGIAILVGGGIALVRLFSAPPAQAIPASKAGQQSLPSGCTPARIPVDYIVQETAGELHMSVSQVKAQVRAGKTISQIAASEHLSPQQLRTLEIHTLQDANNYWLRLGCITRQDAASNMQRDVGDAAFMDEEFTDFFRQ